jgi:hypothetical protein
MFRLSFSACPLNMLSSFNRAVNFCFSASTTAFSTSNPLATFSACSLFAFSSCRIRSCEISNSCFVAESESSSFVW